MSTPGRDRLVILVTALAAIAFVVAMTLTPIYVADFWIQLEVGDLIRETGAIPATYQLTYTEAADVGYVEARWLACLAFSYLFQIHGYAGMIAIKCALSLCLFGLLVSLVRQVDRDPILALLLASLALLGMNFRILMRPELVAFVLALIQLDLLQRFARSGRPEWLLGLLPTSVVWANLHPSFPAGYVLTATFAAGELVDASWSWHRQRRGRLPLGPDWKGLRRRVGWLGAALVATIAISLVNPYGIGLFEHMSRVEASDFIRANVWEWQPIYHPSFLRQPFFFLFAVTSILVAVSGIVARARLRATPVILVLGFFPLALSAMRHVPWFEMVAAYFLAHTFGHTTAMRRWRRPIAAAATLALLAGTWIAIRDGNTVGRRTGFADDAPLNPDVIAFIQESDIEGNVFHSYRYGDQLAYHFSPRIRVAMDTRIYPEKFYVEYRSMTGGNPRLLASIDAFRDYFERYDVRTIVSKIRDVQVWQAAGHSRVLAELGFERVYLDPKTVVLRR